MLLFRKFCSQCIVHEVLHLCDLIRIQAFYGYQVATADIPISNGGPCKL